MRFREALSTAQAYLQRADAGIRQAHELLNAAGRPYTKTAAEQVQQAVGCWKEADRWFSFARVLGPNSHEAAAGLAYTCSRLGRPQEAFVHYLAAVDQRPTSRELRKKLANAYWECGRLEEAERLLANVFAERGAPGSDRLVEEAEREIPRDIGRLRLLRRDFDRGWATWDDSRELPSSVSRHPTKRPAGETTGGFTGRRVMVVGEQGLGDEVMYASCLPAVADVAGECVTSCDARLIGLFRRSLPTVQFVERDSAAEAAAIEEAEVVIAAGSLPRYVRPDESGYRSASYLVPDPARVEWWRERLALKYRLDKLVGLSWRAGKWSEPDGRSRSLSPEAISRLSAAGDYVFLNLQHYFDEGDEELTQPHARRVRIETEAALSPTVDAEGLAALIAVLPLVISVDNANLHLAGALGTRTWALLPFVPDWRWSIRGPTPFWYASVRLVRQSRPGDWESVTSVVGSCLARSCG